MANIIIAPQVALIDEPLSIHVEGLTPRQIATIYATLDLPDGLALASHATFIADNEGHIDLAKAVPLEGSYSTADVHGLIWSLAITGYSQNRPTNARYVESHLQPYDIRFSLCDQTGRALSHVVATRLPVRPNVRRLDIREAGIVATLFIPEDANTIPKPALIVVPGSTGGIPEHLAALYASHGYVALALGYFNAGGNGMLPNELVEIPLEYFGKAAKWLKKRDEVKSHAVVIDGTSRGGELALLLGSYLDEFSAVIAWVPAAHVHHAFSGDDTLRQRSGWTFNGQPLPFVPPSRGERGPRDVNLRDGVPVSHIAFLSQAASEPYFTEAVIPVERIDGPILLISGRDDAMWPSATYADWVVDRLVKSGFKHPVTHLSYAKAGHTVGPPYGPATVNGSYEGRSVVPYLYGGTAEGIASARADLWPKVLQFLHELVCPL